ncbi:hypothetical protein KY289_026649 [Solanum tuberosum]|nr:hypothetical protein KY289_026649 [Solanum tuberosum]KAH0661510.1 hypothetical protein KY284_026441 [Solanum tuberosum]
MERQSRQGDKQLWKEQNDQHDSTRATILEVIDVESSSHFSLWSSHRIQGQTMVDNRDQEQHEIDNKSQSKNLKKDANQAGKSTNSTSSRSAANLSNIDDHAHVNARGKKSVNLNDQTQGRGDTESQQQIDRNQSSGVTNCQPQVPNHGGNCETNSYHKEFPKISSNFDKHTIPNTKGQQTNHPQQAKGPSNPNENQSTKQDQNAEPAPYTVVQTLAARLRQIHATQANSIELVLPKHTDMLKLHLPKEA